MSMHGWTWRLSVKLTWSGATAAHLSCSEAKTERSCIDHGTAVTMSKRPRAAASKAAQTTLQRAPAEHKVPIGRARQRVHPLRRICIVCCAIFAPASQAPMQLH